MKNGVSSSRAGAARPAPEDESGRFATVLSTGRRRLLVSHLLYVDRPIPLTEAARHVAAAEANCRTTVVPTSLLQATYLNLRETHVPELEAAGIVEYAPDVGVVELASLSETERDRLESVVD